MICRDRKAASTKNMTNGFAFVLKKLWLISLNKRTYVIPNSESTAIIIHKLGEVSFAIPCLKIEYTPKNILIKIKPTAITPKIIDKNIPILEVYILLLIAAGAANPTATIEKAKMAIN